MDDVLSLSFVDEILTENVGHCLGKFTDHTIWGVCAVDPIEVSPRTLLVA